MKVLAFGTYDVRAHPRVQVLVDGLRQHGVTVTELNVPLGLSTAQRVQILRQPWRLPALLVRLLSRWVALAVGSGRFRGRRRPDALLVGYLGHFDVLLARLLFPRTTIVLDHLIFAAGTATDRGTAPGLRTRALGVLDRAALAAASVVVLDTEEHRQAVPARWRDRTVVAPVGATDAWFGAARPAAPADEPLRVIFFGLFTPLQGATTIGQALWQLHRRGTSVRVTLVGSGQDAAEVREQVADLPLLTWHDWVDPAELPGLVAAHDVCLGIFGTTDKALKVVPNKVYQGAAAGTAIITSATEPQRRALEDSALLVPPGDAKALADALTELASDSRRLAELRRRARERARERFTPVAVSRPLLSALR